MWWLARSVDALSGGREGMSKMMCGAKTRRDSVATRRLRGLHKHDGTAFELRTLLGPPFLLTLIVKPD